MKNAVIYARFSSHAQNEQSIEGQLKECRAFAERNNLRIVREYIDRALTGTTDKRPDFLQMIEDSKRKVRGDRSERSGPAQGGAGRCAAAGGAPCPHRGGAGQL